MSKIEQAILAVRKAESTTADAAGNMESALYLIERCNSAGEAIQTLGWAANNARLAVRLIDEAIAAAREMERAKTAGGVNDAAI